MTKIFCWLSIFYNKLRFRIEINLWKKFFKNYEKIEELLTKKGQGLIRLLTFDGLIINVRQNLFDARIIREIFINKQYSLKFSLPPKAKIIDIGGYIGDFSLYAAKYLDADKIFVYEPTKENYDVLIKNIFENKFDNIIIPFNKAVGVDKKIIINIQKLSDGEIHASSHSYNNFEKRAIDGVTLEDIILENKIDVVDLAKIDCEGNEYEIILSTDDTVFNNIKNIVFEYHKIDNYRLKLQEVIKKLKRLGYKVYKIKSLIYAKK